MRGRWIVHDEDEDHDHDHDDDEDEDEEAAAALASVAVDDDPEETMGRETVGRKLGEAEKKLEVGKSFGRICHRFGRIWIGRVPASGTFLRITVFILREKSAYGLGPFFWNVDRWR